MRIVAMLLLAVALAGCVTSSKKLAEVEIGMSKAQVLAILGEPKSVSARDGAEILHYQLSGDRAPPLNPNAAKYSQGYAVELVGNKVTAYGRAEEVLQRRVKVE